MDVQSVSDNLEIQATLVRYARAADTQNWDLWRGVFTPDAHLDFTSAGGIAGSRDEVTEWLAKLLSTVPRIQHFITNIEIELTGDSAHVSAMFFNPFRGLGERSMGFRSGWHTHDFVRTDEGWKSRNFVETIEWSMR
jgi:hypothetical protein